MTGLFRPFFATCALFALGACARPPAGKPYPPSASLSEALVANATAQGHHHPHSLSNPEEVRVQHMGIAWEVDFDQKRLEGVVRYLISRPSPNAPLVLDTQGLEILSAFVSDGPPDLAAFKTSPNLMTQAPELEWRVAKWSLGSQDPMLGRPLAVHLEEHTRVVELRYRTTQASHGLQWLAPAQTDDGQAPFLYTQSQPILGRSFIPMQDTPAVRVTYDAKVKVPKELRALMSAQMQQHPPAALPPIQGTKREYTFNMPQAVPSYLIALAVGRLDYAPLGSRSGVWASPSQLAGAKRELAPVEDMITKTEALFGKYRWGQYDVLILPSAFPYGGMENPRVTFATPTILAKDGSLISLIAHELAHSWSGNLVTNANWNDIWLNEGFTTYAERRIVEAVYGKTRARMEAQLGYQDLQRGLEALKDNPQDQRLAADVTGRDPDLLLSAIAYEKGALFLTRLEEAYGREAFDKFIRAWFDDHAFGTATTPQFVEFLNKTLIDAAPLMPGQKPVDLSAWLHEPGLPKLAPNVQSEALRKIDEAYAGFAAKSMRLASLPYAKWSFQEQLHFLRKIDDKLDQAQFEGLERKYGLSRTGNSEIRAKWLELCAKRGYAPAKKSIEDFLISVGRRKFLMPIYTAIIEGPFGHGFAQAVFERAKAGYHAISRGSVEALLANKARS